MGFAHALPPLEFRGQPFDAGVSFVLHVWQQERNIEPNFFGHIVSPFNGLTACGASLNAPTLGSVTCGCGARTPPPARRRGGIIAAGGERVAMQPRVRHGMPRTRDPRSRSEEHTSELQSLMRISYAVFCLKKKKQQ